VFSLAKASTFTPQNVAVPKMTKPWEAKELRDHHKKKCIAQASFQAENLLSRRTNGFSYGAEIDGNNSRLVNCSFTRVKLNSAFSKWRQWLLD